MHLIKTNNNTYCQSLPTNASLAEVLILHIEQCAGTQKEASSVSCDASLRGKQDKTNTNTFREQNIDRTKEKIYILNTWY